MNAKVAVAEEIVRFCKESEARWSLSHVNEEFARVREAFERVVAAAAASQPPPADFKQGEPGVAECACEQCQFSRFKLNIKGTAK